LPHSDNVINIHDHDSLYQFPDVNQRSMYAQHNSEPATASSSSDGFNLPSDLAFYRGFVDAEVQFGPKLPISDYYEPAGFLYNNTALEHWWCQLHSQLDLQFHWSELPNLSSADTFDICNLDSFWNLPSNPAVGLFRNDLQTFDQSSPRGKALMDILGSSDSSSLAYDRSMFRSIDLQEPTNYEQIQMGSSAFSELADQPFPLEARVRPEWQNPVVYLPNKLQEYGRGEVKFTEANFVRW
jgi:hypothetical protein